MLAHRLRSQIHSGAIKMIHTGPSTMTKSTQEDAEALPAFYGTIYAAADATNANVMPYLAETELTPLPESEAETMDDPIHMEEVVSAIAL
ncbi:hypothetical protein NDU88_002763 [Pleurodeles waltl]|uniref:Uncharacterized protein n=1 Tax=Pleurodeles waltl TaxID=8319 RepID=A0AAV7QAA5_PLEWA|nr:hypothetical protein NDU88_002763 [Pleurodeles waltl]